MGKATISMAIFNSYICLPEGIGTKWNDSPMELLIPQNGGSSFLAKSPIGGGQWSHAGCCGTSGARSRHCWEVDWFVSWPRKAIWKSMAISEPNYWRYLPQANISHNYICCTAIVGIYHCSYFFVREYPCKIRRLIWCALDLENRALYGSPTKNHIITRLVPQFAS